MSEHSHQSSASSQNGDTEKKPKWNTLEHHAVTFPPPYKPLPKHVKLKIVKTKQEVELSLEAEEMACWWAEIEV
jgi:DNA topoisomerase-1